MRWEAQAAWPPKKDHPPAPSVASHNGHTRTLILKEPLRVGGEENGTVGEPTLLGVYFCRKTNWLATPGAAAAGRV